MTADRRFDSQRRRPRVPWTAVLTGVLVAMATLLIGSAPAAAHTGFESSTPSDQTTVDEPVDVVTIEFTGPATPVGEGFVALNGDGIVQQPAAVTTDDDQVFTIRFDPPLAGGTIGVRWHVQAADAHPIEGAFSFTVTAPAVTSSTTTTTAAGAAEPVTTAATMPATTAIGAGDQPAPTVATDTAVRSDEGAEVAGGATSNGAGTGGSDGGVSAAAQSLDEFLTVDESVPGETTALIGRILSLVGVALALGAVVFTLSTLRGTRAEVRMVLTGAAVLAGMLVLGAATEYVGAARLGGESLASAWTEQSGMATVLRLVGGVAMIVGVAVSVRNREFTAVGGPRSPQTLSAAVVEGEMAGTDHDSQALDRWRWTPTGRAWPIAFAAVAMLVSFWFDGHTVTRGFRPLHAVVDTVHVAAGSIWVGGVVALCAVGWSRRRRHQAAGTAEMVVRFSRVATLALGAVVVAGGLMAFMVLDSLGDLTSSEWGQTLLLKTAAVLVAVAVGAYNHFRLVPALDGEPASESLRMRLRSTITFEAIILVFVVVVTAWLVAAAT